MQHASKPLAILVSAMSFALVAQGCTADVSNPSGDDPNAPEKFSDHYQPNQLNASYGAFAADGTLKIFTALLGEKGFVRLRGGDTIEVEVNGQKTPTTERILDGGKVHYIASMPNSATADTEIKATFVRGVDRVVGKIKLAGDFTLKTPPTTAKIGESPQIDLDPRPDLTKWTGPLGISLNAKAEVNGPCLDPDPQELALCSADSEGAQCKHAYPLKLDTTKLKLKAGSTGGCEVNVQVRLRSGGTPFESEGPANAKFKGGGWEGYRTRTFKMQLTQ
jgi:hypothetical protein